MSNLIRLVQREAKFYKVEEHVRKLRCTRMGRMVQAGTIYYLLMVIDRNNK
jgi:hypothetical protein